MLAQAQLRAAVAPAQPTAARLRRAAGHARAPATMAIAVAPNAVAGTRPAVDDNWREDFDRLNAQFFAAAATRRNALRSGGFAFYQRKFPDPGPGRMLELDRQAASNESERGEAEDGTLSSPFRSGGFVMQRRLFPDSDRLATWAPRPAAPARASALAAPAAVAPRGASPARATSPARPASSPAPQARSSLRTGGFSMPRRSFPASSRLAASLRAGSPSEAAESAASPLEEVARITQEYFAAAAHKRAGLRSGGFAMPSRKFTSARAPLSAEPSSLATSVSAQPRAPAAQPQGAQARERGPLGVVLFSPRRRVFSPLPAAERLVRSADARRREASAATASAVSKLERLRSEFFGTLTSSAASGRV